MQPIYLVVGVPGSGKTTICNQLKDQYEYFAHDQYKKTYLATILELGSIATKPILIETPFSVSELVDPLTRAGFKVNPVFIIESAETVSERYTKREGKPISKGHLTRLETYKQRAKDLNTFSGTSNEVLEYLRNAEANIFKLILK